MKRLINCNNKTFSHESPVICCPVMGETIIELLNEIKIIAKTPADVIEWRVDYFKGDIVNSYSQIIKACQNTPVILTYRTKAEGGLGDNGIYEALLNDFVNLPNLQILDIELSLGFEKVAKLVKKAKENVVITIVSAHFFHFTPDNIEEIYEKMEKTGGDIPKLAVMPQNFSDVLKMMEKCEKVSRENSPIIGISMSKLGLATRLCPTQMGSCLTFASGIKTSAPGQIEADVIKKVISV